MSLHCTPDPPPHPCFPLSLPLSCLLVSTMGRLLKPGLFPSGNFYGSLLLSSTGPSSHLPMAPSWFLLPCPVPVDAPQGLSQSTSWPPSFPESTSLQLMSATCRELPHCFLSLPFPVLALSGTPLGHPTGHRTYTQATTLAHWLLPA